ncbi:MAG: VWA domain-containing protein [Dehalococcoidia bacterium]
MPSLDSRLAAFARVLRLQGLPVTLGSELDAARSLGHIDPADRAVFHAALRANLTTSVDQYAAFDEAFGLMWGDGASAGVGSGTAGRPERPGEAQQAYRQQEVEFGEEGLDDSRLPGGEGSASDVHIITRKDFAEMDPAELRKARILASAVAPTLATVRSRRTRPAASGGTVDLRRTIRQSRRTGGELITIARQKRRLRKLDLVALLDVSGSMDRYSEHLLQFVHALQHQTGRVRTFVFSTRLHEVTPLLERKRIEEALAAISDRVDTWSGGTSIGACLAEFNQRYGKRLVGPRTIVLIASDGWERGETALLERQLAILRRRSHRLIWLNPLKGREGYEPLAAGMASALPYVDDFLPANSLAALRCLATLLRGGR